MPTREWESATAKQDKGVWRTFPGLCKGCGLCIEKCPVQCIGWSDELGVYGTPSVVVDIQRCLICGLCQQVCPDCAIRVDKTSNKAKNI